eukprot:CAMPEP_0181327312 /NCGR_PEP_ID=MMETSP1101-20121128/22030_1 /TAXON_ID=46948 /ORGANISM="Rhodomonas abbreviata, Strain Caron Lab Isolate" /LENGTH=225 /DNA_ID=CAMNT_0023435955 /DNA_START=47 /DNA_END=724 /DNA_ORIENTATION=+
MCRFAAATLLFAALLTVCQGERCYRDIANVQCICTQEEFDSAARPGGFLEWSLMELSPTNALDCIGQNYTPTSCGSLCDSRIGCAGFEFRDATGDCCIFSCCSSTEAWEEGSVFLLKECQPPPKNQIFQFPEEDPPPFHETLLGQVVLGIGIPFLAGVLAAVARKLYVCMNPQATTITATCLEICTDISSWMDAMGKRIVGADARPGVGRDLARNEEGGVEMAHP